MSECDKGASSVDGCGEGESVRSECDKGVSSVWGEG